MKKRFLVAAMACAVALGGFAGFVNADEPKEEPKFGNIGDVADFISDLPKEGELASRAAEVAAIKKAYVDAAAKSFDAMAVKNGLVDANHNLKEITDEEFMLATAAVLGVDYVEVGDDDTITVKTPTGEDYVKVFEWANNRKLELYKMGYNNPLGLKKGADKAKQETKKETKGDKKALPNTAAVR